MQRNINDQNLICNQLCTLNNLGGKFVRNKPLDDFYEKKIDLETFFTVVLFCCLRIADLELNLCALRF